MSASKWQDKNGKDYTAHLNLGAATTLTAQLGTDFVHLSAKDLKRVFSKGPILFNTMATLHTINTGEAVDPEAFIQAIDVDTLDRMCNALLDQIAQLHPELRTVIAKTRRIVDAATIATRR
ncbi:MAG TPA: hypothetical protein VFE62_03015 [Gemmataceae bacterium]|nr:hypothetical protein [Gemmataceae bacterium]